MPDAVSESRPHAVVIGSGFGGLAAAIRLGARGYRVTVVEKLDAPGGRAYVYRQDGFTFDAGPTIITAPYLLEELWTLCGRRMSDDVELRRIDPFYRIRFDDGTVFNATADFEAMRAEVERIEPGDVPGFERFIRESEKIYEIAFHQLADQPFHKVATLLRSGAGHAAAGRAPDGLHQGLAVFPQREAAHRLQLPSPADRRQPVHHHGPTTAWSATWSGCTACITPWAAPAPSWRAWCA